MAHRLDDIVSRVDRLPTLNSIATKIINICTDPHIPISRLVTVISLDQSLYAQILKVANSSYFNYPRTIVSVEKAIVLLGFNLLRDLAVSIAVYSFYKGLETNALFNFKRFWAHTIITGLVGQALAEKFDPEKKDLIYVAGLLHDIGKLVESRIIREDFNRIMEKSRKQEERIHLIETQMLGFNHGDVGALLLNRWNLPESLVNMVKFHHHPPGFNGDAENGRLIRLIYLSNLLAHYIQDNFQDIGAIYNMEPDFSQYFPYTEAEFNEIVKYVKDFLARRKVLGDLLNL